MSTTAAGSRASWPGALLLGCAVLALALVLGVRADPFPTSDVAWLLEATRRLLAGERLGVALVENTPPMIYLVQAPAVAAATALGVRPWHAWLAFLVALAAGMSALAVAVARPLLPSADARRLAMAMLLLVTLVLPGFDFGQREHVMLLLTLPYVALAGVRLAEVAAPSRGLAAVIGVLAALGVGIKPHFALLPLALLAAQVIRTRSPAALRRPEHVALALTGAIYVGTVLVALPGWVAYARRYGPLYASLREWSAWEIAVYGAGALPVAACLLAWLALRRRCAGPTGLLVALLVAAGACEALAVLQLKGWRYHFLPALAYATLFLGLVVLAGRRQLQGWSRLVVPALLVVALAPALDAARDDVQVLVGARRVPQRDPSLPALLTALGPRRPAHVAVFSSNMASSYPLLTELGATSASRHPLLWPFRLDALSRPGRDGLRHCLPSGDRAALADSFWAELASDLRRTDPEALVVMLPDTADRGWEGARHIDYLGCLRGEPALRAILARYGVPRVVGTYLVVERP